MSVFVRPMATALWRGEHAGRLQSGSQVSYTEILVSCQLSAVIGLKEMRKIRSGG